MLLTALLTLAAQKPFDLSVDNIMRGPELVGQPPRNVRWSADGKHLTFTWKDPNAKSSRSYSVNTDGTGMAPDAGDEGAENIRSADGQMVASIIGDQIVVQGPQGRRTYHASKGAHDLTWMADGKGIAFAAGQSETYLALESGMQSELAEIVAPGGQIDTAFSGQAAQTTEQTASQVALGGEQRELFPDAGARRGFGGGPGGGRGRRGAGGGGGGNTEPGILELKANQTMGRMDASPDGVHVAIPVFETNGQSKGTIVPNYITADGYTADINSYPKVGDIHSHSTLAITIKGSKSVWVSPPDAVGKRDYAVRDTQWSKDGKTLLSELQTVDHKDRWLLKVDPDTGKSTVLFADHDDAWLGGPGSGSLGWLPDHKRMYFESEKSGWAQLYTIDIESGDVKQVTDGKFEVSRVRLSKDGTRFYFISSEDSPFKRHFDSVSVDGGPRLRLLPTNKDETLDEDFDVSVSPDETRASYYKSTINHPPELYIADLAGGKETKLTESTTAEWRSFKWTVPERVEIPASDGVKVPGDFYRPAHFRRGGPAVIFVHGAGYLQNVHDWWKSAYYHEYMFHHILASKGVAVLDLDYRASAGYGRDWRTAIYRFMGGKDLDDNVDGAKWLVSKIGVDPKRIGVYGGSYGGFITLMAMFTKPGVFAAGAALRPVSDWANYNDGYTSDILNLPQDDKEAYRRSSPIFHAEGLQGNLLICHGVVDTNVHYQDTVRLVQRLIDLKKENWSVAFYPMEDHTFSRQSSWSDEYRRILKLFQETLHF